MKRALALVAGVVAIATLAWFFLRDQQNLLDTGPKSPPVAAAADGHGLTLQKSTRLTLPPGGLVPRQPGPGDSSALGTLTAPFKAVGRPASPLPKALAYLLVATLAGFLLGWLHRALRSVAAGHAPLTGAHPDRIDPNRASNRALKKRIKTLGRQLATAGNALVERDAAREQLHHLKAQHTELNATLANLREDRDRSTQALSRLETDAGRNTELRATLVERERTLENLHSELADARQLISSLEQQAARADELEQTLTAQDSDKLRLQDEIVTLQSASDNAAQRIADLENRAMHAGELEAALLEASAGSTEQREQLEALQDTVQRSAESIRQLESDKTRLADELNDALAAIQTEAAVRSDLEQERDQRLQTIAALEQEQTAVAGRSDHLSASLDEALTREAELNRRLDAAHADGNVLERDTQRLRAERDALLERIEAANANGLQHDQALDELRSGMADLEAQLDATRLARSDAERDSERQQALLDKNSALLANVQQSLAERDATAQEMTDRCAALDEINHRLAAEHESLQITVSARDERIEELTTALTEQAQTLARWQQQADSLGEQLTTLQQSHSELEATLSERDQAVSQLTGQLEESGDEIAGLLARADEYAQIEARLTAWHSTVETYRGDLRQRDLAADRMRAEIERLAQFELLSHDQAAQIDALDAQLADHKASIEHMQTQLGARDAQIGRLDDQLQDRDTRIGDLTAQSSALETRAVTAETHSESLQAALTETRDALDDERDRGASLREAIDAAAAEQQALRASAIAWQLRVPPLETRISVMSRSLQSARETLARERTTTNTLESVLAGRLEALKASEVTVDDLQAKLTQAESHIAWLASEKDRLEGYEEKLANWDSTIATLRNDLHSKDSVINGMHARIRELDGIADTATAHATRVDALNIELERQTGLARTLKRGVDNLRDFKRLAEERETAIHAIKRDLEARSASLAESETLVADQVTQLAALEERMQQRDIHVAALEDELADQADAVRAAEQALKVLQASSTSLEQGNAERDAAIVELNHTAATRLETITQLEAALGDAREIGEGYLTSLRGRDMEVGDLQTIVDAKLAELEEIQADSAAVAARCEQLQGDVTSRDRAVADLHVQVSDTETANAALRKDVERLAEVETRLRDWDSTVTTMRDELRRREVQIDSMLDALSAIAGETIRNESWRGVLDELTGSADTAQQRIAALEAQFDELRAREAQLAERAGFADRLEQDLVEREEEIRTLWDIAAQRDVELVSLRDSLDKVRSEFEHARYALQHDDDEIERLTADIATRDRESLALQESIALEQAHSSELEAQLKIAHVRMQDLDAKSRMQTSEFADRATAAGTHPDSSRDQQLESLLGQIAHWRDRWQSRHDADAGQARTLAGLERELRENRDALAALEEQAAEIEALENAARGDRETIAMLEQSLADSSTQVAELKLALGQQRERVSSEPAVPPAPTLTSVVKSGPRRAAGDDK